MKLILGDNQFFGINHSDLEKGKNSKNKFNENNQIKRFINDAISLGLDGFMINSNKVGYEIISRYKFDTEIHYSIPYPHKYASMVNENGLFSLFHHAFKKTSLKNNLKSGLKILLKRDLKYLSLLGIELEVPKNLKKGSYVYLQNIITDLLIGLDRGDIINEFIKCVSELGYRPGIITLNPTLLHRIILKNSNEKYISDLIVCFNINLNGFNVFPKKEKVEKFIKIQKKYKLMGMSIFSSGSSDIKRSIKYIKSLRLDYVVFGSSSLNNIKKNITTFKN